MWQRSETHWRECVCVCVTHLHSKVQLSLVLPLDFPLERAQLRQLSRLLYHHNVIHCVLSGLVDPQPIETLSIH